MAKLGDSSDPGKVLDAYNPPQAEFKALRAKLAELRKGPAPAETKTAQKPELPRVHVPDGKILRPGMKDPRVTAVRKRLDIAGDKENQLYDDAVRDAVKTFQTENDINVDGNLGPNTVRTLNGERTEVRQTAADPTDTIIVNMERWRWVPRDLGNPHVVVNVPDYTLWLYNNDKVYWHTKIVVGKPNLVTPMVSAEMKFITVNPTWNVPPSIIEKEYLPALEADPQALDRIGLKLTQDADGTIHISQPPGAGNALGRIRFNFPNKFLVYQHDTPDKHLFSRDKRAFSHGCMRVHGTPERVTPAGLAAIQAGVAVLRDPLATTSAVNAALAVRRRPILWLSGNVHGNEESGADASLQVLYELADRTDCAVSDILANAIVVILPTQNPDGREEQTRRNLYGFDMNRDWFARTQPETDGKLEVLRQYPPMLFIDAHEFGLPNYFFPPNADPEYHEIPDTAHDWINELYSPAIAERVRPPRGIKYFHGAPYDFFAIDLRRHGPGRRVPRRRA